MNKKGLAPALIIGIILVIAVIGVFYFMNTPSECGIQSGNLDIQLFDVNGQPICDTIQSLSVVNGARGVGSMSVTVKASNNGVIPLSCNIYSATVNGAAGTVFDTALTRTNKFLDVGQDVEWTSNLFSPATFEASPSPDVFAVTVRCQYNDVSGQKNIDQTGTVNLNIQPDGTGSFIVNVGPPEGIPSLYCGDNVCSSSIGETSVTCSQDCSSQTTINYRTTDTL